MKKILFSLLMLLQIASFAQISPIKVIPEPVDIVMNYGAFDLTKTTTIGFDNKESKAIADLLIEKINAPTGFNLKAQLGTANEIQLNLNTTPNPTLGKEGYTLLSTSKGVTITANQTAGLYYGCQTLLQLFPKEITSKTALKKDNWRIPAATCTDYPRFAWRGTMLDVSRHFFSKEDVKTYIDQLTAYKYNTFHWHLTDDEGWRIEIKSLPKLTEIGACRVQRFGRFGSMEPPKAGEKATDCGFYTHEDIKEIVQYAQARNVTIVPEIDVPGHSMAAIAAYPELSCQKDPNTRVNPGMDFSDWYGNGTFKMNVENALDPSEEKVYEFLDKVFTEVAMLFPNPYIHVGGDECYKGYWKEDESCQALMKKLNIRHVEDLQGYFMGRVEKILTAKGKKLLGWDEILEGGISPNATVMSWRGIKGGIEAAESGHEAVMTPTTFAYLDYNQGEKTVDPPIYAGLRVSKSYSYEPVPEGVDAKFILGGQGNLWTEHITTLRYAQYMTYPRAWALSEVFWSPKSKKKWDKFAPKMEAHFERSDIADINYSKAVYDPIVKSTTKNGQLMLEMGAELADIDIYYTLDDAMPDRFCTKYAQPIALPDGPVVLRAVAYRKGQPIGHLITLDRKKLEDRADD
jgi:hexosaminidase